MIENSSVQLSDDSDNTTSWLSHWPWLEIFFLVFMMLSGAVSMMVSYSISDLADNCDHSATTSGIVFLFEAIGALVGGIIAMWAYHHCVGNTVLIMVSMMLGCVLLTLPYITTTILLELAYFGVGVFLLMLQIGCIHLVRCIQLEHAGHWLAMTQAAHSAGGCFFLFLDWEFNLTLFGKFCLLSVMLWLVSVGFYFVPVDCDEPASMLTERAISNRRRTASSSSAALRGNMAYYNTTPLYPDETDGEETVQSVARSAPSPSIDVTPPSHYHVELIVGMAAVCANGIGLMVTSYISPYAEKTHIETPDIAEYQLTLFWFFLTIGRILGSIDQTFFITDDNIVGHTNTWILCAIAITILWFPFWLSSIGLWIIVPLLGLFVGPIIGYAFDYVHRLTLPSEASSTILMLWTFVGGHIIVYSCSAIWSLGAGPRTLIGMVLITLIVVIPCMMSGKRWTYLPMRDGGMYQSVSTHIL